MSLETLKAKLRGVLLSNVKGVLLSDIRREYQSLYGESLNFYEFGYPDMITFLRSMPEVASLMKDSSGKILVRGIALNNLNIIANKAAVKISNMNSEQKFICNKKTAHKKYPIKDLENNFKNESDRDKDSYFKMLNNIENFVNGIDTNKKKDNEKEIFKGGHKRGDKEAVHTRNDNNAGYNKNDNNTGYNINDNKTGYNRNDDNTGYNRNDDNTGYNRNDNNNGYNKGDNKNIKKDDNENTKKNDNKDMKKDEKIIINKDNKKIKKNQQKKVTKNADVVKNKQLNESMGSLPTAMLKGNLSLMYHDLFVNVSGMDPSFQSAYYGGVIGGSKKLKPPELMEVIVTHFEADASFFWGIIIVPEALSCELDLDFDGYEKELSDFSYKSRRGLLLNDSYYCRVWVKMISGRMASIQMIDFGQSDSVAVSSIKSCPDHLWFHPPSAVPFKLIGDNSRMNAEVSINKRHCCWISESEISDDNHIFHVKGIKVIED